MLPAGSPYVPPSSAPALGRGRSSTGTKAELWRRAAAWVRAGGGPQHGSCLSLRHQHTGSQGTWRNPCPPPPCCHRQPQQLSLPVYSFPSPSSQPGPCLHLSHRQLRQGTSPSSQATQPAVMGTACSHWGQPRWPLPNIPISSRKQCGSLWQWGRASVLPVLLSSLFADLPSHSVSPLSSQEGSRNT